MGATRSIPAVSKVAYLSLILFLGVAFAATACCAIPSTCTVASDKLKCGLKSICDLTNGLLPIIAFVLFVVSGVSYALGNFFGAEMRAKAIGYSMNLLTGAIISLILAIIGPTIITALSGSGFKACTDI